MKLVANPARASNDDQVNPACDGQRVTVGHKLSREEVDSIHGGFFWGCNWVKPIVEVGEECNNGICVPYIEEGDY